MADTCENLEEVCEKIMDKLWDNAIKATLDQFEKLEKEGKLSPLAEEDLDMLRFWQKIDPKFCLKKPGYNVLMFYYFDDYVNTPYRRLRFHRYPEDGHRVVVDSEHETHYPYGFNWMLEKDLAYLELEDELKKCDKIKLNNSCDVNKKEALKIEEEQRFEFLDEAEEDQYWAEQRLKYLNEMEDDECWPWELRNCRDVNILEARRIAEQPRFESLEYPDVHECVRELLHCRATEEYLKAAREICFCLLGGQEQLLLRTGYGGFLATMAKKFPLVGGISAVRRLVSVFDRLAQGCHPSKAGFLETSLFDSDEFRDDPRFYDEDPGWNAKMRRGIEDFLEAEEKMASRESISRAEYIRLKLKLAKEIGIVGKDEYTGQDVEIHRDIFFGESKLSDALDKLKLLG